MTPDPETLTYDDRGLLPVVVQDVASGAVLMVAWADRAAVARTAETGFACFFSRSRGAPWMKGETSGNRLRVVEAHADCDRDTLLLRVDSEGPACHTGAWTCFEPVRSQGGPDRGPAGLELGWLARTIAARRGAVPETSYTARLLAAGPERIGRKLAEEAMETVLAAVVPRSEADGSDESDQDSGDGKDSLAWEAADLLYHLLVLLESKDVDLAGVAAELARRHRAQEGR